MTAPKCDICDRRFTTERELERHEGREHGTNLGDYGGGA